MALFHFRVHLDKISCLDKLVLFIRSKSVCTIIAKEIGERPHIHSIISPLKTKSTFMQQFHAEFPNNKGNGAFSCETVKELESLKLYICKGENKDSMPDVLYSTIDTKMYHEQYWTNNAELKKDNKNKKEKTLTWIQQVKVDFAIEHPSEVARLSDPIECRWKPDDTEIKNYKISQHLLLGFILKRLGKSVKVIDDNVISRLYKGIQNSYIQDGVHTDKFTSFMLEKLNL